MKKIILITLAFFFFPFPVLAHEKESVYERVIRTNTLRCTYFVIPPEFNKDPNTGKLSGIGYEVTEAVAKALNLKVEWGDEVGFTEMTAGLENGKYDAICSSVFNSAAIAREADFTIPFMYTPVGIFVRQGDTRFDDDRMKINDPNVTISTIDGETAEKIAAFNFSKAKTFSMPQTTNVSMLLENVASQKADVAFTYMANYRRYNDNNPGKLKSIHEDQPIRAFGNTIMLPKNEPQLKAMLNTALHEIIQSGQVDEIISKYEEFPGTYYRLKRPYER